MPRLFRYQTHVSRCTATSPEGNCISVRWSVAASNSKLPLFPPGLLEKYCRRTKKKVEGTRLVLRGSIDKEYNSASRNSGILS